MILDLAPKGRDEDDLRFTMEWVRYHDRYGTDEFPTGRRWQRHMTKPAPGKPSSKFMKANPCCQIETSGRDIGERPASRLRDGGKPANWIIASHMGPSSQVPRHLWR